MEKRTEKLSRILNELNIDGLFITDLYNIRYFTGFTGTTGVALATKNGNFFFSDFRYKAQATKQVTEMGFEFVEVSRGSLQTVGEYIKKFGLKNVGFEDINVSFSLYQTIKDIFKVELVPVGNKLIMERMVKSDEEIALIKKAVEISDVAFSEALKIIKEGVSEKEIADIIYKYGEEPKSRKIAKNIVEYRKNKKIETTLELSEIIIKSIGKSMKKHPSKRTFQAIRIFVNKELEVLEEALDKAVNLLNDNGKLLVITFHSLEDRMVKEKFREYENPCTCPPEIPVCVCNKKSLGKVVTRKPITAKESELNENNRAHSAKLRIFERKEYR